MAHIIVSIDQVPAGFPGDGTITVSGSAHLADSNSAQWSVALAPSALAAAWTDAVKDAAIAAINATYGEGTTGGLLDKITLFGGAVGL